jgi:hypothetical protein
MKALTLTQPWATAVAMGMKRIETRSWGTSYRGDIAIHAAKGFPKDARSFASLAWHKYGMPVPSHLPLGAIIAVVNLVDCIATDEVKYDISEQERTWGDYHSGRSAWLFDRLRVLDTPIPCKGALSLWVPSVDDMDAIIRQVEAGQ